MNCYSTPKDERGGRPTEQKKQLNTRMCHINVERWVQQDNSTATMFCAVAKHDFTAPFG